MLENLKAIQQCHLRLVKIWERVEKLLKVKFNSEPIYSGNEKYIKTKIKIWW